MPSSSSSVSCCLSPCVFFLGSLLTRSCKQQQQDGETIAAWRNANYHHDPKYESFKKLLEMPKADSELLLKDRYVSHHRHPHTHTLTHAPWWDEGFRIPALSSATKASFHALFPF